MLLVLRKGPLSKSGVPFQPGRWARDGWKRAAGVRADRGRRQRVDLNLHMLKKRINKSSEKKKFNFSFSSECSRDCFNFVVYGCKKDILFIITCVSRLCFDRWILSWHEQRNRHMRLGSAILHKLTPLLQHQTSSQANAQTRDQDKISQLELQLQFQFQIFDLFDNKPVTRNSKLSWCYSPDVPKFLNSSSIVNW